MTEVLAHPPARLSFRFALDTFSGRVVPIAVVALIVVVLWYIGAIGMNADLQRDAFANAGQTDTTTGEFIEGTWSQERPRLPAPHQILAELDKSILRTPLTSKRSLVFHAMITMESTLLGFIFGSALGIGLSILVIHSRSLDRGMMPWIVASQTVPIVAPCTDDRRDLESV